MADTALALCASFPRRAVESTAIRLFGIGARSSHPDDGRDRRERALARGYAGPRATSGSRKRAPLGAAALGRDRPDAERRHGAGEIDAAAARAFANRLSPGRPN